jgi:hypothetical protein
MCNGSPATYCLASGCIALPCGAVPCLRHGRDICNCGYPESQNLRSSSSSSSSSHNSRSCCALTLAPAIVNHTITPSRSDTQWSEVPSTGACEGWSDCTVFLPVHAPRHQTPTYAHPSWQPPSSYSSYSSYSSLLTPHYSLLTPHSSLLTPHYSLFLLLLFFFFFFFYYSFFLLLLR